MVLASLDTSNEGTTTSHAASLSPYNPVSSTNFTLIFQGHVFDIPKLLEDQKKKSNFWVQYPLNIAGTLLRDKEYKNDIV